MGFGKRNFVSFWFRTNLANRSGNFIGLDFVDKAPESLLPYDPEQKNQANDVFRFFEGYMWGNIGGDSAYDIEFISVPESHINDLGHTDIYQQLGKMTVPEFLGSQMINTRNGTAEQEIRLRPNPQSRMLLFAEEGGILYFNTYSLEKWNNDIRDGQYNIIGTTPLVEQFARGNSRSYEDFVFEYDAPYNYNEAAGNTLDLATLVADIKSHYNFYNKEYEQVFNLRGDYSFINDGGGTSVYDSYTNLLPNMYCFIAEKEGGYLDADNSPFRQHMSLLGLLEGSFVDIIRNGEKVGEEDKFTTSYFTEWAQSMYGFHSNARAVERDKMPYFRLANKFRNLVFTSDDIDLLTSFEDVKRTFPMYNTITFSTSPVTKIADMLQETALGAELIKHLQRIPSTNSPYFLSQRSAYDRQAASSTSPSAGLPIRDVFQTWDIDDFFDEVTREPEVTADTDSFVVVGRKNSMQNRIQQYAGIFDEATTEPPQELVRQLVHERQMTFLSRVLFLGRLLKHYSENQRSIQDVFGYDHITTGATDRSDYSSGIAYSETIYYEIEKIQINRGYNADFPGAAGNEPGQVVQRIYIPNSKDLRLCEYVDTQIRYGRDYMYKIYAYQMVFGSEYTYENVNYVKSVSGDIRDAAEGETGGEKVKIDDNGNVNPAGRYEVLCPVHKIKMKPKIKVIKVPYHDLGVVKVLDKPPVAPDIDFVPYKGISDRLLLNLNANNDNYKRIPEPIEVGEVELNNELMAQQKNYPDPTKIEYKSDDPPAEFLIYRTIEHPESYSDFAGFLRNQVSTKISEPEPTTFEAERDAYLSEIGASSLMNIPINASAVSIRDSILPNTKYYYMFRTIDIHGHYSYPSPVYEVEMIEVDGANYLVVNIVDFRTPIPKPLTKAVNERITIKLAPQNLIVNLDEYRARGGDPGTAKHTSDGQLVLGLLGENNVYGEDRRFKIRFTSRHTGRKFDLNVSFKYDLINDPNTKIGETLYRMQLDPRIPTNDQTYASDIALNSDS